MRVLLVRPRPSKKSLGLMDLMTCEPLELEYVSSWLKTKKCEVFFADMIFEKRTLEEIMSETNPDMVCTTAYITHVNVVKDYAKAIKDFRADIITAVGGVHSEVNRQDFECGSIDYVLGINGVKNLGFLVDAIEENKQPVFELDFIDRDFLVNMPLPDREITAKYRAGYDYAFHAPCALIKTSYGCPQKCSFCYCIAITRRQYWERPLDDVVEELKQIKEQNVFIVDDDFLVSRERVGRFCELVKLNNIKKRYIIFGRADFIANNRETMKSFRDCGLEAVFVGVESFRQEDLNDWGKRCSVELNEKAIRVLNELEIDCYAGSIAASDWDKKDFRVFTAWLKAMKVSFVNIQPLVPLPGTPIHEKYKDRLLFRHDEYERWDLTHIIIKPEKMSLSAFYLRIIISYLHTTASYKTFIYIRRKYGAAMAKKSFRGGLYILRQYIVLMVKALGENRQVKR